MYKYKMSLELICLKNNLLIDANKANIKAKILNRIHTLNLDLQKYIKDNEFLLLICNLVEHLVRKKDKINKSEFVVEIFNDLFNISDEEKDTLRKNIEFLHSNKRIKKISYYKLFVAGFSEWFRKK